MRLKAVVILALCLSPAFALARPSRAPATLRHPLIIGASVSSGLFCTSPGDRAALRYTPATQITNNAHHGHEAYIDGTWTVEALRGFSAVIAVDYLFWDTANPTYLGNSILTLRSLVDAAQKARVPLVLGDVPGLISNQNPSTRDTINAEIHRICRPAVGCRLLQFDLLHRKAYWDGININGQLYHYADLTADGLHLNDIGAEYVADMIVSLLN